MDSKYDQEALEAYLSELQPLVYTFEKLQAIETMWIDNRTNNHAVAIYKLKDGHHLRTEGQYRWLPLRSICGEQDLDRNLQDPQILREFLNHNLLPKFDGLGVRGDERIFRGDRFNRSERVWVDLGKGVRYKCECLSTVMVNNSRIRLDFECQYQTAFDLPKPVCFSFYANLKDSPRIWYRNSLQPDASGVNLGVGEINIELIKNFILAREDELMRC